MVTDLSMQKMEATRRNARSSTDRGESFEVFASQKTFQWMQTFFIPGGDRHTDKRTAGLRIVLTPAPSTQGNRR